MDILNLDLSGAGQGETWAPGVSTQTITVPVGLATAPDPVQFAYLHRMIETTNVERNRLWNLLDELAGNWDMARLESYRERVRKALEHGC